MRRGRTGVWAVVALGCALGLAGGTAPLAGQEVKAGGQVSFGDDADFGIGPRAQLSLPWLADGAWFVASYDYFFPDSGLGSPGGDFDYRELNVNLLVDVPLARVTNLVPYAGAGANVAWQSVPAGGAAEGAGGAEAVSERLFGVNLVAGFRFPLVGFTPFVEMRYELSGGEQLLIAGGVLLP